MPIFPHTDERGSSAVRQATVPLRLHPLTAGVPRYVLPGPAPSLLKPPMRTPLLLAALSLALAGCDLLGKSCTDLGCIGRLTLTITADGAPVTQFSGTITVGDTEFTVACDGADSIGSAATVSCGGDGVVYLSAGAGGDVTWDLVGADPTDTGSAGSEGQGSLTPDWETTELNGPGCGTCTSGEATITLDVVE